VIVDIVVQIVVQIAVQIAVTFAFMIALSIAFTIVVMIAVAILLPAIATGCPAAETTIRLPVPAALIPAKVPFNVSSQKEGVWGVLGGCSPPKTPHFLPLLG
jgi:hypothetical protein